MAYCIMNIDKQRRSAVFGLQIEANRTKDDGRDFDLSDIDKTRTDQNVFLRKTDDWNREITRQIHSRGLKERKDSVVMITGVYTMSPEWLDDPSHTDEMMMSYFRECLDFHIKTYCGGDESLLLNAVVHMDETTPHLQIASVPIVEDEKGPHLSAKIIMGDRNTYRLRQDRFFDEVGSKYDMSRGERRDPTERKLHLTKREYQKMTLDSEISDLERKKSVLDTTVKIKEAQLSETASEISEIDAQIAQKKTLSESYDKTLIDVKKSLKKGRKDLEAMESTIDAKKSQIAALEGQITTARKESTRLRGENAKKAYVRGSLFGEKVTVDKKVYDEIYSDISEARDHERLAYEHSKAAAADLAKAETLRDSIAPKLAYIDEKAASLKSWEKELADKQRQLNDLIDSEAQKKLDDFISSLEKVPDGKPRIMEDFFRSRTLSTGENCLSAFEQYHRKLMKSWGIDKGMTI